MENNTAAPVDAGQADDAKAGAPEATGATSSNSTAPKPGADGQAPSETTSQPTFDVQKSYDELRKQFTKVTQDYSRDRRTWNQTLQELQSMKQSQAQMAELLSKATEAPIDPAQFAHDLQTQGPKALDAYLQKHVSAATQELQQRYVEQANAALSMEIKLEKLSRRMDTKNYPDWDALEPIMNEIADPDNPEPSPIDWNQPVGLVYDALYKLARSRSSEDAVKAAEEFGRKQAEKSLGKEAATAVPGGGKAGGPINPASMSVDKLREFMVAQLGEAE